MSYSSAWMNIISDLAGIDKGRRCLFTREELKNICKARYKEVSLDLSPSIEHIMSLNILIYETSKGNAKKISFAHQSFQDFFYAKSLENPLEDCEPLSFLQLNFCVFVLLCLQVLFIGNTGTVLRVTQCTTRGICIVRRIHAEPEVQIMQNTTKHNML